MNLKINLVSQILGFYLILMEDQESNLAEKAYQNVQSSFLKRQGFPQFCDF